MTAKLATMMLCAIATCSMVMAAQEPGWWNPRWQFRTTVTRPTPYRSDAPRPVEVAVDFPLLLKKAGVEGEFDPASVRIIERTEERQAPFAWRTEFNAPAGREQSYLTWMARPTASRLGVYDIYFDTRDRGIEAQDYPADRLPPENLLANPGFEDEAAGLPSGWEVAPAELASLGACEHTTGERSLKIQVDENTPDDVDREVTISQRIDVREFAGQEMAFECDLLAERAAYGAPVCIELRQFRADGSRIPECAIQPRWLTLELAQGQLVQFRQRGRFDPEAATVEVHVRLRCYVRDADTGETVTGPESFFTVWLDRVVVRPGERWPWPAATNACFAEGALENAPLNRGFEFTGQRRLAFNGASEATLTASWREHDPKSVHWGLQTGTLEFWCKPSWNADDGRERIFFQGYAYLYRLQSRLRKLNADGNNDLEFTISDSNRDLHTVRGPAPLQAGRWHHLAATWDLPKAQLQLFVDGKRVAAQGPGAEPWPSSLTYKGPEGTQFKGNGISDVDKRSIPMQAFIGGRMAAKVWSEGDAAEAVLDEFRISDVVRYSGDFTPAREEFAVDDNTRVLFHFENERNGVHGGDDRFVRAYLDCEHQPQEQEATLEVLRNGEVEARAALVKPYAPEALFERNRGDNNLKDRWEPPEQMPDPRFVEYRKRQVERIVTGRADDFTLEVGGDLEPLMGTVTFERAEDAGPETTLLPRWRANDNVVPFSAESLAATLAPDAKSDPEKAFAVMQYVLDTTAYYDAHYCETLPGGRHRPRVSYTFIKALNIYPYDQCGPLNFTLRKLFLAVGISSNNSPGTHHQFQQAYFDGDWRLYDLSARMYWLHRDNETVLGLPDVGEDPYCKLRQPGNLNSYYPGRPGGPPFGSAGRPHNMDFPLRAGERASISWQNEGRWFEVTDQDRRPISLAKIPPYFGNGAIVYEPTGEGEAAEFDNLAVQAANQGASVLRAQDPAKPASLIYRAECPYIFADGLVTGDYQADQAGAISLSLSFDEGENWTQLWRSPDKAGEMSVSLLEQVAGRYAYWLKVELAPDPGAAVTGLKVRTVLVNSALSLPGKLSLGENRISFTGGPVTAPIKTTCSWIERRLSDLGVSLNAISYYNLDHARHRNLFIAAPGDKVPVRVTLQGRKLTGEVSLEGLPEDWGAEPGRQRVAVTSAEQPASVQFTVSVPEVAEGQIHAFEVVVRDGASERRVPAEALVADAPLVREAERADEISGEAAAAEVAELSRAEGVTFTGDGSLAFDFSAPVAGKHALWLRARWQPGSRTSMTLRLDEGDTRQLRIHRMIGFYEWTNPERAYTKGFVHYPRQGECWAWYRVLDWDLATGEHRLTLGAGAGAQFDAVVLLPQNAVMDRAANNLFTNWNYGPWNNPL